MAETLGEFRYPKFCMGTLKTKLEKDVAADDPEDKTKK
jgi:hypothetical protein